MYKIYKTLKQEEEEKKQEQYSRDLAKAKKQVEKQKLLLLLENQVKTYLKQIENKNINLYDFNFSTYAKTEIINIVLMQYKQKDKFYLDYKDYYFNFLYFKFDSIANKVLKQEKQNYDDEPYYYNLTHDQMTQLNDVTQYSKYVTRPKSRMGSMLGAIFFQNLFFK